MRGEVRLGFRKKRGEWRSRGFGVWEKKDRPLFNNANEATIEELPRDLRDQTRTAPRLQCLSGIPCGNSGDFGRLLDIYEILVEGAKHLKNIIRWKLVNGNKFISDDGTWNHSELQKFSDEELVLIIMQVPLFPDMGEDCIELINQHSGRSVTALSFEASMKKLFQSNCCARGCHEVENQLHIVVKCKFLVEILNKLRE